MSGPIVRKYGFPNFEKIFGARPILHGVDDEAPKSPPDASKTEAADAPRADAHPSDQPADEPNARS